MNKTSDVLTSFKNRYYVYVLFSLRDKKFYIGFTVDLKKRLTQHSKNLVPSTKFRTPFKLIHYEYFVSISDAKAKEKFLKSGFGRNELKKALKTTLSEI